jgi:hypothetical protein
MQTNDGGELGLNFFSENSGTKNIARNPLSSNWLSQPNEYQTWPMFTIEWYIIHKANMTMLFARPVNITKLESPRPLRGRRNVEILYPFQKFYFFLF